MNSSRRILLGSTAAATGALLGCAVWYGTARTLLATSRTPSPASPGGISSAIPSPDTSTDAASSPGPAQPALDSTGTPASDDAAETEFRALSSRLQAQLEGAANRQESAREALVSLQRFVEKYPSAPARDKAFLSLGNVQLGLGDTRGAIASFERVVNRPIDVDLQPLATLMLGKARAQAGEIAAARSLFRQLVEEQKGTQYAEAAAEALGRLSIVPGQRPPAFLMRDLHGRSQSPDLYHGKVLLLDFWATWCGPCREEMPNLKALHAKYGKRGFAIVGISLDTDRDVLRRYLEQEQIPWPQICDGRGSRGELVRRMGVLAIPTTILIDRNGVIRRVNARGPALEAAVRELVGRQ